MKKTSTEIDDTLQDNVIQRNRKRLTINTLGKMKSTLKHFVISKNDDNKNLSHSSHHEISPNNKLNHINNHNNHNHNHNHNQSNPKDNQSTILEEKEHLSDIKIKSHEYMITGDENNIYAPLKEAEQSPNKKSKLKQDFDHL